VFIYLLVVYLTTRAVNQATHVAIAVEILAGLSFMLISQYLRKSFYADKNV